MRNHRNGLLWCVAILAIAGCGPDPELVGERDDLAARVAALQEANALLEAEVQSLRETDQGYWETALLQRDAAEWTDLDTTLADLLRRWPASPLAGEARALQRTARSEAASELYNLAQSRISAGDETGARARLERIVNEYGDTPTASGARRDLQALAARVQEANRLRAERDREAAQQRLRAQARLELTAFSWSRRSSFAIVEGMVKNISSTSMNNVQAVAIFTDREGQFVTSDSALIEYRPVLAGQSSPFSVIVPYNPAMQSARMEFKEFSGGEIQTYHSWND